MRADVAPFARVKRRPPKKKDGESFLSPSEARRRRYPNSLKKDDPSGQLIHFHQRHADAVVCTAHDRGVVATGQVHKNR